MKLTDAALLDHPPHGKILAAPEGTADIPNLSPVAARDPKETVPLLW